jgi:3-oxoacyl-[acyl-carrier protein] reductase
VNAFITGGSRGIGRAIVLKMVKEGVGCAFTYMENEEAAEETRRLAAETDRAVAVRAYRLDVKKAADVESVVERTIGDFGDIHVAVNNAGALRNNAAAIMSNEEWEEVIAADLSGPFYVIRSLLMHFLSNRKGRIINISSLAEEGASGQANYAAAKAGLIGLTKTLAKEYGAKGITSNVVTVGYVPTDMTGGGGRSEELRRTWVANCPMKRMGTAEEIASLVHYLSTEEAGFINGEVIRVSGGLTYVG